MSKYDEICYKRNFISRAIFRIDYPPIFKLEKESPSGFQEKIKSNFPISNIKEGNIITTGLKDKKEFIDRETFNIYEFLSENKKHITEIAKSYLGVTLLEYGTFEDFKNLIEQSFSAFNQEYAPTIITRIGLRYINEIKLDGNPLDWTNYINGNLLSSLTFVSSSKLKPTRLMNQINYLTENYSLTFNHGIFNVEYPSPITRKEFILDYDCYTKEIKPEFVLENLNEFHAIIQELFEKSIDVELKKIMGVKNE